MYAPSHFDEPRVEVMHALMQAYPLATLITLNANGIEANHIPVVLDTTAAPLGCLRGHVARGNPLWREHPVDTEVLLVFQGEDAYISPSWYASKAEGGKVVPTWNYVSVHARGKLRIVDDAAWLRRQLEALTAHNEATLPHPWSVSDAPADYIDKLLTAIVGFEVQITSLQGKWKVSQNRPVKDQHSLSAALHDKGESAMAQLVTARGTGER